MKVSKEEILHIAKLANLNIDDAEIDKYILNLQDILNFANIVNNAPIDGLTETVGATENYNVFRKDEVKEYKDVEGLLQNAPEQEEGMFRIPKVINLKEGMVLTGTVRNVIDFGAFVDIGVKHDGLVHISEMSEKFIKNPSEVVSVGDVVKVKVIKIDKERQKVGLSMKV